MLKVIISIYWSFRSWIIHQMKVILSSNFYQTFYRIFIIIHSFLKHSFEVRYMNLLQFIPNLDKFFVEDLNTEVVTAVQQILVPRIWYVPQ